ncbi:apolipoprotein N-acyltransferase [Flexistipes sinusarabici]|nr:apolipoprotein N-acyltransferase [Flexistipes sinusarabici]
MKNIDFKHILLPAISAVLLVLASPGVFSGYLSFFALVPLMIITGKSDNRELIISIIIFCLVYYLINLNWITIAVSHFGNAPLFIGYAVLIFFIVYLAVYWAVFLYFFRNGYGVVLLSLLFVILEIVRGRLFTGFPWLNFGSFAYNIPFFKLNASLIGEQGLSFLLILSNLLIFQLIHSKKVKYLTAFIALVLISFGSGYILNSTASLADKKISFRIIQPSYKQENKWIPAKKEEITNNVLGMLEKNMETKSDIIVLPESVFPAFTANEKDLHSKLQKLSKQKPIIFGSIRLNKNGNQKIKLFNSVYYINDNSTKIYDKIHLVPFGEYFPFKTIFKPINYYFFGDAEDFTSGDSVSVFMYNGTKMSPLLCYEGAFTNLVNKIKKNDADILILLTNDSWFGKSFGRYQHLAIDVIRSIEYGMPVVRAAQSGISGCITPGGNAIAQTKIDKKTAVSCSVPSEGSSTLFAKLGYSWLLILIIFYALRWITNYSRRK